MNFAVAMGVLTLHVAALITFIVYINVSARKRRSKMTHGEQKADDRETATIAQEW